MSLIFNIGDTIHVITPGNDNTIDAKCVADQPNVPPYHNCTHCIFYGQTDCLSIFCLGFHFEPIEIKEAE